MTPQPLLSPLCPQNITPKSSEIWMGVAACGCRKCWHPANLPLLSLVVMQITKMTLALRTSNVQKHGCDYITFMLPTPLLLPFGPKPPSPRPPSSIPPTPIAESLRPSWF